ncbi:MAG: 23S rRNA (pseudouridine(1915)-N(3))-methyltransferase RlmH [Acidobacteriota bacterium]|jgi:23S rRNA (pseudouridine1915-N3)-methyltransferase|nr:23S rRNA (pseudouridine(1915)-N(3))-methyltransferase RlmH [Acidobacteriota bacterium]
MKLKILWVGKTKSAPIKALTEEYLARIRRFTPCDTQEVRDLAKAQSLRPADLVAAEGEEISRHLQKSPASRLVALDEGGRQFPSEGFARWLGRERDSGAREIAFVIGGAEGLSRSISTKAHLVLSLGEMTWTHEMCRALLLEQIYRALCILHKIPYHKGAAS